MGAFSDLGKKIREEAPVRRALPQPPRAVVLPEIVDSVASAAEEKYREIRAAIKAGRSSAAALLALEYVAMATNDPKLPKDYVKILKPARSSERKASTEEPEATENLLF